MLYLITILVCMIMITLSNYFLLPTSTFDLFELSIWTAICTLSAIAIDGLFATVVRRLLPEKWFSVEKKIFCAGKKESRFYEKLGIKKWKDKVLELGVFTSFRKNKVLEPYNNEYVSRYIIEANFGIICHVAGVLFGVAVVFCCPKGLWLTVGLPVTIVNTVLSTLPIFILRYNLPKLHTLYKFNERKSKIQN